ncbi:MAG: PPC domain-containing protein [Planctomycetales bacterium]|nr:PPC domain-containing protein [Planctomycetales bacterium]
MGELGLAYMQSSADEFVSMYVTGQSPESAPNSMSTPVLVKAGDETYLGGRGGDYNGIAVDPATGSFWAAVEVILDGPSNPFWSTWIGEFQVSPLLDQDWYAFYSTAGDLVAIETATPGDGPRRIANDLDPQIEIYASDGTLLDADDNSAADGRNARLTFTASTTDVYYAKVVSADASSGAYYLSIVDATGSPPVPRIVDADPADQSVARELPTVVQIQLSSLVLATSIDAADVSVGGLPATDVTIIDGRTLQWTVDPAASIGDGTYEILLDDDALLDLGGNAIPGWSSVFYVDSTGPRLVEAFWNDEPLVAGLTLSPGFGSFVGRFDEDLFTISSARRGLRTPGGDDLELVDAISGTSYAPTSVAYNASTFTFSAEFPFLPEGNYTLRLRSGDGAFEDAVGNDLDGETGPTEDGFPTGDGVEGGDFVAELTIDVGAVPSDLRPFERVQPLGTQIFASQQTTGALNSVADVDRFQFAAVADEFYSVRLTPLQPTAILTAQIDGIEYDAAAPGETVLVEGLRLASGQRLIEVTGSAAIGYAIDVFANATSAGLTEGPSPYAMQLRELGTIGAAYQAVAAANGRPGLPHLSKANAPGAFVDISSTGTRLAISDDGAVRITTTVGNSLFPAGTVTISNNGGIIAGNASALSALNSPLPEASIGVALLPYWADIDSDTGAVYWQERLVNGQQALIVQWNERPMYPNTGAGTFQVILFASGPELARFAYRDVDFSPAASFGSQATIGIQTDPGRFVQFSYNEASLANNDVIFISDVSEIVDVDLFEFAVDASDVGVAWDAVVAGDAKSVAFASAEVVDPHGQVVARFQSQSPDGDVLRIAALGFRPLEPGVYQIRIEWLDTTQYTVSVARRVALDTPLPTGSGAGRNLDVYDAAVGYLEAGGAFRFVDRYAPDEFIDISTTGEFLSLSDDEETTIVTTIGNSIFPAGETTIANNGGILASAAVNLTASNGRLPVNLLPAALFPYWDDIDGSQGGVYWQEMRVGNADALIVQWENRPLFPQLGSGSFQVQLFGSGPVLARFAYRDVDFEEGGGFGAGATIGVQLSPVSAVEFSYNASSVADGDVIDVLAAAEDHYFVSLAEGDLLHLEVAPIGERLASESSGSGPTLRLYGVDGELAAQTSGAGEGLDSQLDFYAGVSGVYKIVVELVAGKGEYLLEKSLNPLPDSAADFNSDGHVNGFDFLAWQRQFGGPPLSTDGADADHNAHVDGVDLQLWAARLGAANDDFANAPNSAAFTSIPSQLAGRLEYSNDVDVVGIEATAGLKHAFAVSTDASTELLLELLDASGGDVLASTSGLGEVELTWTPFAATNAYLRISSPAHALATYQLSLSRDDHGDDASTASVLTSLEDVEGVLTVNDEDWFRVSVNAASQIDVVATGENGAEVTLQFFDADGSTLLDADVDGGDAALQFETDGPRTLYVAVASLDGVGGAYELAATVTPIFVGDQGSNPFTAQPIEAPGVYRGTISPAFDRDWFSFVASPGVEYRFTTTLTMLYDSVLTLFDVDGVTELAFNDDYGPGFASQIVWTASTAGVYYVEVRGYSDDLGDYLLTFEDSDHAANLLKPDEVALDAAFNDLGGLPKKTPIGVQRAVRPASRDMLAAT